MGPPVFSNVAYVILGFLAPKNVAPLSGYDIKQRVDISTRFFFAASYGQIYPELKKLADAGLIEVDEEAVGARSRTTYKITRDGRGVLRDWLMQREARIEMRDQGLLRVFLSEGLTGSERIEKLQAMRDERAADLALLKAIQMPPEAVELKMPDLVLDYGLGLYQYVIDWCDRTIAELKKGD